VTGAVQKRSTFQRTGRFDTGKRQQTNNYQSKSKGNVQTFKSAEGKTYAQMIEGVSKDEIKRRREAKESLRCAWPSDRKGAHGTMKCFQSVKVTNGTADFVKPRTYQKLKVGGLPTGR
jgi:hypothetical protein